MYLLGAFYDDRLLSEKGGEPLVRVIGIGNRIDLGIEKNTEIWCQLWFPHLSTPKLIKVGRHTNMNVINYFLVNDLSMEIILFLISGCTVS